MSVCVSGGHDCEPCKTAEPIGYSVGRVYLGGPKEPCVKWWPGSPTEMALGGQNPHTYGTFCVGYTWTCLGGPDPPRKWHFLCWIYLDVLGGQDPPREGHFLWGIYLDMLGPARGRCTQRYSQRTATMRPLATNIAAACFCFRRQTFFCLFFRRSLRRRESIARSFA